MSAINVTVYGETMTEAEAVERMQNFIRNACFYGDTAADDYRAALRIARDDDAEADRLEGVAIAEAIAANE